MKVLLLPPLFVAGITIAGELFVVGLPFAVDIVADGAAIVLLLPPDEPNDDSVVWCCKLLVVDTGTDADEDNCWGGQSGDSSCNPNNFSNSFGSLAPGKSCLLAKINIGTPCGR